MFIVLVFVILIIFPTVSKPHEIAALILARGGSKGVYLKNLQTVGGVSLLARTVHSARVAGLGHVTVSTDHPLIALEALKCGADIFHRSSVTSSDVAPSIWGCSEFLDKNPRIETLILLQPTSPFTRASQIRLALDAIKTNKFDCVFSVTRTFQLRWKENKKFVSPINFDLQFRPRRQSWRGELVETGAFYVARRSLLEAGYFQNHKEKILQLIDKNYTSSTHYTNTMSSNTETVTYEELENTDVISVELVPEKKGLILKHCEYYVSSHRHGTTVTRRYNEFSQLYDVLLTKYPYRAICSLPPKRVNVNGGSPRFLQRRRAALQRWLTLVARHPVLAHDADLRAFLCEPNPKLERPKHDEFMLAGCQDPNPCDMLTEDLQATCAAEQDHLRLVQLGLERLLQIFDKVESRLEADRSDMRALGAGLGALSSASLPPRCPPQPRLTHAARVASEIPDMPEVDDSGPISTFLLSVDAVAATRALAARLARAQPPARLRYALKCQLQEAQVARAYALAAVQALPELFCARAQRQAEAARLWADIHAALDPSHSTQ